jgi:pimeloyl-ACP methyl ester carboxylesterase
MWRSLVKLSLPAVLGVGLLPPATAAEVPVAPSLPGRVVDGRVFLAFDPTGDGTAVEVIGDLATADHVVVLVPGVATTLADFDRGLGGAARRAPARQARAVRDQLLALSPRARVAVVAWLGYDPPDGLGLSAARRDAAARGADALVAFVAELRAARPRSRLTAVGHSYGAMVVGLAAARLDGVADLVALGAPGMGVRRAADLGTPARVWAAQAPDDWIRWIPGVRLGGLGHGTRPADPAFGARGLPVAGVSGHDGYLAPGSATLRAIAAIALGEL